MKKSSKITAIKMIRNLKNQNNNAKLLRQFYNMMIIKRNKPKKWIKR